MQTKMTCYASPPHEGLSWRNRFAKQALALLFFMALVLPNLQGQTFIREYGDDAVDEGGGVLLPDPTPGSENLYLAGYQGENTVLIFMDGDGNPFWTRTFHVSANGLQDRIMDLKFDEEGNMIGCGFGINGADRRYFAFRYDVAADVMLWMTHGRQNEITWAREINDIGNGEPFVVTGSFTNGPGVGNDALRFQLDRNTGVLSGPNQSFDIGSSEDFSAAYAVGNRVFVTGRYNNAGCCTNEMRPGVTELNPAGNSFWTRLYLQPLTQDARLYSADIEPEGQGRLRICGSGDLMGTSATVTNLFTFTTDFNGLLTSRAAYDIADFENETAFDLVTHDEGDFILGFEGDQGQANPLPMTDLFILNVDINNNLIWARRYGDTGRESFYSNTQSQIIVWNNSLYFTAQVVDLNDSQSDMVLYRVNLDGTFDDECPSEELTVEDLNVGDMDDLRADMFDTGVAEVNRLEQAAEIDLPDTITCGDNFECYVIDDPQYQQINANLNITTDQAWTGKYYIAPGVIITVDGVTLDLTNVDMVFEECAGIDFINEASLRANNSVFRTCNPLESWRGFRFEGNCSGVINECTYKNAVEALASDPGPQGISEFGVRITNNLFANNRTGIDLENSRVLEGITGNTFVIEEAGILYGGNCAGAFTADRFGVRADNADFAASLSQNDFAYADTDQGMFFHGVAAFNSDLTVSLNHFTNLYGAVELTGASGSSVENNEIELTREFVHHENQIRLESCAGVGVTGNVLSKYDEVNQLNFNTGAIYGENCTSLNIKENEVNGFGVAIQIEAGLNVGVSENVIDNANLYGIYAHDGDQILVSCNQVHMRQNITVLADPVGMVYILDNVDAGSQIQFTGNCVSDAHTSLALESNVPNAGIPTVVNNFFYNYTDIGVNNDGFTGNIGSSGASFAQAGRNTFRSNNIPNGALDVNSVSTTITAGGNFGISSVFNVTVSGNNTFHSTASCGLQIESINNQQIGGDEVCDRFSEALAKTQGQLQSGEELEKWLQGFAADERIDQAVFWLTRLNVVDPVAAQDFKDFLIGSEALTAFYRQRVAFTWAKLNAEWQSASALLSGMSPESSDQMDWLAIESLLMELRQSGRTLEMLTASERSQLRMIMEQGGKWAKVARELMQSNRGNHNYVFEPVRLVQFHKGPRRIVLQEEFLTAFPNPAQNEVKVQYFMGESEGGSLELYDLSGRMLQSQVISDNASERILNVKGLPSGVYILSLSNGSGRVQQTKLIKY